VCGDAVTKVCHFGNVASATQEIEPSIDTYLNKAEGGFEATIQARHKAGQLHLKAVMATPNRARAAGEGEDEADPELCAVNLHCARPSAAKANNTCDIMGVVGYCCSHGIPLRQLFCNMPTNEQYCYYLLSLQQLVGSCTKLDVYIDFGCRLKKTWQRYVHNQDIHLQEADVRILVNWMHGASHEMSCQLQNCGRYQTGAGWRHGEQLEQLWSLLKVHTSLLDASTTPAVLSLICQVLISQCTASCVAGMQQRIAIHATCSTQRSAAVCAG
jgi:hypothetical protein